MAQNPFPPQPVLDSLKKGLVIPAHPLALTPERKLDEKHQRALTRYYLDAGSGGLAVGVHTTQFEIRKPDVGLLRPVLELANDTMTEYEENHPTSQIIRIAGICGKTEQAVKEAQLAREIGYHIGLLSLGAYKEAPINELITHAQRVAEEIPLMGFYLQPSVGGRVLDFDFWAQFCEIQNAVAIKIAPFNRYQTLDVVRAVAETGRENDIALYTGNDDNILVDLLSTYKLNVSGKTVEVPIVGGLLGHWAVWTKQAADLLEQAHDITHHGKQIPQEMLSLAIQITDTNAAFFDPPHNFAGCIAGIHEVLCRQGLLQGRWCLNPEEDLSPGQMEEIDRVYAANPHLNDDAFVAQHLDEWLK